MNVVGLWDPLDGVRSGLNVRYSHFGKRCWILGSSVSFSRSVNVSLNKVSVVVL